jgi:hypothetical protein
MGWVRKRQGGKRDEANGRMRFHGERVPVVVISTVSVFARGVPAAESLARSMSWRQHVSETG